MNLKPCPFRIVGEDGHILCEKIKSGDREVSPNICRACPVSAINCAHLRATLDHRVRPPITVRYGNGRTEVWDDVAPSIALERAACSAKVIPITSPRDCVGCPLRQAMVIADQIRVPITLISAQPRPIPPSQVAAPKRVPVLTPIVRAQDEAQDEPRKNLVAGKIAQLQEWLTKQKKSPGEEPALVQPISPVSTGLRIAMPVFGEEKRAGWTD